MENNSVKEQGSQSTEKVFLILEYMTGNRLPVRLQDAAEHLGMPQPTLLRYFNTMIRENYVYQDEDTKKYALTWKICRLGHIVQSQLGIRSIVGPYLLELANELELGTCVVVLDGYDSIYADLVEDPTAMMGTLQRIGKRVPLHTTGSGKVLLSQFADHELEGYLKVKGMPAVTEYSLTDPQQLRAQLEEARARRFARDRQECEENIQCISVPLYDYTDRVTAAMSAFGPVHKTPDAYMEGEVLEKLMRAAREISLRMGCDSGIWQGFAMPGAQATV